MKRSTRVLAATAAAALALTGVAAAATPAGFFSSIFALQRHAACHR